MKASLVLSSICAVAITVLPAIGLTQETEEAAKAAFREGKTLFEQEEYAAAADHFRKAYELKPSWKLLYNIGQSEAAARRYGIAMEMFERFLAMAGDQISTERRDNILEEVARLQKMVAFFELKGAPDGAVITVDGVKRGETPLPGPVAISAGLEHNIAAIMDESVVFERVLRLSSRQNKVLEVSSQSEAGPLVDEEPVADETEAGASDTVAPAAEQQASPLKPTGIATLAVGAAALVGWGIVGGMAISLDKEMAGDCANGCPPSRNSDMEKLDTMSAVADVLLGVGVGLAVTGGILLLVGKKRAERQAAGMTISPTVARGFAGGALEGSF